jgi:hypothetical protein
LSEFSFRPRNTTENANNHLNRLDARETWMAKQIQTNTAFMVSLYHIDSYCIISACGIVIGGVDSHQEPTNIQCPECILYMPLATATHALVSNISKHL